MSFKDTYQIIKYMLKYGILIICIHLIGINILILYFVQLINPIYDLLIMLMYLIHACTISENDRCEVIKTVQI